MPSAARDERIAVPSELDPERVRSFLKAVDDRIRQLSRAWPD